MILTLENIYISLGCRNIFKGFSADIQQREIAAIVGPSGCGKTTLLNMIAGVIKPDSGKIVNKCQKIGYVFQEDCLLPWKTVYENIWLVNRKKKPEIQQIINDVGLSGFERYYPHQLSGGMRQRCSIARAFNYEPELLLMDEPFSSLDVNFKYEIMAMILKMWKRTDITIIFVTHNIDEALFMADRVIVLKDSPAQIKGVVQIDIKREERKDNRYMDIVRQDVLSCIGTA